MRGLLKIFFKFRVKVKTASWEVTFFFCNDCSSIYHRTLLSKDYDFLFEIAYSFRAYSDVLICRCNILKKLIDL